ncbi:AAA family ATPase [Sphingobacterium lactis]|uniref:Nicotinamide-nucleotide adenylyltransferase, NadR type n=1 Tax=Sphingobacterium lactis TaxID=797291 RepID=A0A1H6A8N1_9SPHI|nr:ATP-binding protein [Sphingobacterium lactis]SEG44801.1 nicotinamide-nucleotide adenylyltransferase, NadR type [Sphingobacterium lactis]
MEESSTSLIKIAVVGPESTGKSTMAQYLAQQLDTICVPEYARYYCQDLNNQYTVQDEVNMYYGQIALEDSLIPLAKQNLLICDTTILTVKIWTDHLFGSTPAVVTDAIKSRQYDLYLLMDIDLPWEDDPLRDFPNEREHFLKIWKKELANLGAQVALVSGLGEERLKNGLESVTRFLDTKKIRNT